MQRGNGGPAEAEREETAVDASIQKYQAFVRTVELGSFTKAAESLSYSQSGVSRMVADLEREWKVALLERGRAGVRLTSEGTRLLPCIRRVCEEHARLQAQVDELNGLQAGLIRIGTFSSVATHWLPNVIRAFQEDYPNIDYELLLGDYGEIEEWVLEGRVDCGFLRLPAHRGLETAFIERDGLSPRTRFTTWDDYAIMAMVECGLGVSILPGLILRRAPYRIAARPLEEPAYRTIGLALRSREAASLATQRFLEYLDCR